jgi:hypothetical protein
MRFPRSDQTLLWRGLRLYVESCRFAGIWERRGLTCQNANQTIFGLTKMRMVSDCLRSLVNCVHSVDDKDETRYHPFHAHFHAWWRFPNAANWYPEDLLRQGITATMKGRLESISETSVSFHLVKTSIHEAPETNFSDRGMRRYHAILFGLCPNQSIADVNPFKK